MQKEQIVRTSKKWLLKIGEDIRSHLVGTIVGLGILAFGGWIAVYNNLLSWLLETLKIQTPLWLTILLVVLGCLSVYLIVQKKKSVRPSKKPPKVVFFQIGKRKWKTEIYEDGFFEVDKYPYCVEHDLQFIYGGPGKYCPEPNCNNSIQAGDSEFKNYESAKSFIEKKVRNKDY